MSGNVPTAHGQVARALLMALGILWLAQTAGASEPMLLSLGASANPVQAGQTVALTLTKKGPKCAVLVNYGAGTHHVAAKAGGQQLKLPALVAKAGTWILSILTRTTRAALGLRTGECGLRYSQGLAWYDPRSLTRSNGGESTEPGRNTEPSHGNAPRSVKLGRSSPLQKGKRPLRTI